MEQVTVFSSHNDDIYVTLSKTPSGTWRHILLNALKKQNL